MAAVVGEAVPLGLDLMGVVEARAARPLVPGLQTLGAAFAFVMDGHPDLQPVAIVIGGENPVEHRLDLGQRNRACGGDRSAAQARTMPRLAGAWPRLGLGMQALLLCDEFADDV